jgi:hypothetical protein
MAVNPAQPRIHEPDNSMAPKRRASGAVAELLQFVDIHHPTAL